MVDVTELPGTDATTTAGGVLLCVRFELVLDANLRRRPRDAELNCVAA